MDYKNHNEVTDFCDRSVKSKTKAFSSFLKKFHTLTGVLISSHIRKFCMGHRLGARNLEGELTSKLNGCWNKRFDVLLDNGILSQNHADVVFGRLGSALGGFILSTLVYSFVLYRLEVIFASSGVIFIQV
uniref:Uncharacterized protein n=1 Tax=Glossina palpalis gambiensis TaxID=67801 RepID=A0A1B0B9T6_9MUSC